MNPAVAALLQMFAEARPFGAMDDSRKVRPGDIFLAYPEGHAHIPEALAQGAVAVCWEPGDGFCWNSDWPVPNRIVPNLRGLAGPLAQHLAGNPSEALSLLAVTGTNGKTTVSQWLMQAWPEKCACIGTLGAGFAGALTPTGWTTPEAPTLARCLSELRAEGARAVALEASSIGIEEGRLDGCRIDTALFTNFTQDHLDYHGSMEAYATAKEKLFLWPQLRLAVLNLDDALGRRLARTCTASKMVGYSLTGSAELPAVVHAENLCATGHGQAFRLVAPQGRVEMETRFAGRYNIANLLAVAAVLLDRGLEVAAVAEKLAGLTPPPGRMESYGGKDAPLVLVDYAHTPDALQNALDALRPTAEARGGRLFCVFGCGGSRDPGKRPLMGEIAARAADAVWLTSDNPRNEDPLTILADIRRGIPEGVEAVVEADRARAIYAAMDAASDADVVLVAGKGHEPCQEIAGARLPFLDAHVVQEALAERATRKAS